MIPLEDNFADVLGKALRGLKLDGRGAAAKAGIAAEAVRSLLSGQFDESAARALASVVGINPDALVRLARGKYAPSVDCPPAIVMVTTPFGGMTVNAYILWDGNNRDAAIFDTGADAAPILEAVASLGLNVISIFLTHSHADHIHALAELKDKLGVEAWSSEHEPVRGTNHFRPGDLFNAGQHFIRTRLTPGHSPGGTTFVIEGRIVQAAVVGDALFAGSIGGVNDGYAATLENIRREILSLPPDAIICPGHGPMTSVAQEKANNPFFA